MAERRALGRGLGALLPGPEIPGIQEVPLDAIAASPHQPRRRFEQADLEELAASIREQGVISPLILRRGGTATSWLQGNGACARRAWPA